MYRRTQRGTVLVLSLLVAVAALIIVAAVTDWHPVVLGVAALFVLLLVAFSSLTIEIDREELRCFFGPGWIGRRIPVDHILAARAVRNRWYWGWGIRLTPSGWMFNVSGLDAVELELRGGKRFRVGTDAPTEVIEAIEELRPSSS